MSSKSPPFIPNSLMLRKPTPVEKSSGGGGGDYRLLHDLETLSKALSVDAAAAKKATPTSSVPPFRSNPNPQKDSKKSSFWNWKPLRALSKIRNRRFDCRFSLHVHSVDNLPQLFSGSTLIVNWRRTTDPASSSSSTRPVRVFGSGAEFEETLNYRCSVHGTRTGSNGSAKYESRHFLIWVSVLDSPEVDLGRNLVDLTRLLPLKLEELEEEEDSSSGKWSTTFRLSGKGKGASINVSFGFSLAGNGSGDGRSGGGGKMTRTQSVEDIKVLHEVFPSSRSDLKSCNEDLKERGDPPEFMVIEKGIGIATDESKLEKVEFEIEEETEAKLEKAEFDIGQETKTAASPEKIEKEDATGEEEVEKIDEQVDETSNDNHVSDVPEVGGLLGVFSSLSMMLEPESQKSPRTELKTPCPMSYGEVKADYKASGSRSKSLSVDDETIASEFLSMLGIDHSPFGLSSESDPESPREQLWKQFEDAYVNSSTSLIGLLDTELIPNKCFDLDMGLPMKPDWSDGDFDLSAIVHEAERDFQKATQVMDSKSRAIQMEDAETETLMREWGLDEKAFQGSSSTVVSRSGFGSPIDLPPEELPPLFEGLGPLVQTKDGGFLRSMSPSLFKNAKNNGHLIMQASSPVVVPAEMGSGIIEILQRLASLGIEKLSMQAKKLMPLEDVSGTGQEYAGESRNFASSDMSSEYVSLEDLAPFAMDKIEALSIEGLRIQSGMSGEEAPWNISPQSIGEISALEGKGAMNDIDGLMGLSITLEEWMRLDSGIFDEISDRTAKVLAAHRARATEMITVGLKKGGLLGNNFTVTLMLQLRDPLRDYEPVGNPMLSIIQVERVFVSEKGDSEPETKTEEGKEEEEDVIPQFKIREVHISGLKTEPGKKKKVWGNPVQQQSGSRWLLATGMGKSNKHPFMKSKTISKPSPATARPREDALWSISSHVHGNGAKWKELLALNPHIRNPNVIFPNETIRLK